MAGRSRLSRSPSRGAAEAGARPDAGRGGPPPLLAPKGERGYALLGLIIAMMVLAVLVTAAVPNARLQAKRQLEIELFFRGEQMAEAIARYYTGGKLSPAGLIVRTPPPPYGFLTELKKLRDGVPIGSKDVYFVRRSAFVDPLTGDEWEPIRIGDKRLRKYFRQWQTATGRQIPPIYASYLGAGNIVDTTPQEDGEAGDEEDEDEWDEEDEDDWDEEDEAPDGEDGEDEEDETSSAGGAYVTRTSFQTTPSTPSGQSPANPPAGQRPTLGSRGQTFSDGSSREGPIIGVVSKAKGTSLRTRFGIEKYEEMLFIYIPANRPGLPGQLPGQTPSGTPPSPAPPQSGDDDDDGSEEKPADGGSQ